MNSGASDHLPDTLGGRRLCAFLFMVAGMFMATLDIQITAASLPQIQAGLSASADEIPWVQTAYLIAEVVMIPLSGFLSRALGTRVLFAVAAAGFTLMSLCCATAGSMTEMMIYRAAQGFLGGAMIPTVFSAAYTVFPKRLQPAACAIVALVATLAPTIGPTVGGYLTETWSWPAIFLVNVGPGVAVALAGLLLINFDQPDRALLRRLDLLGLLAMALFLGSLEYVLAEGASKNWMESGAICLAAAMTAVGAAAFLWRSLTVALPIVELRAFANRNFAMGSLFSFLLGIGLYGLTYLYPLFLAQIRGYDPIMIGRTVFISGLFMLATAPLAARLSGRLDPRLMLLVGLSLFAAGMLRLTSVTADWDFWELFVPQALRGSGIMLSIVAVTVIALGNLPPEQMKNASGLFNLMRNLGGAVGLAVINTLVDDRRDLHFARLAEAVNATNQATIAEIGRLMAQFQGATANAQLAAVRQLAGMVWRQAEVMAFGDVFFVMSMLFFAAAALTLALRKLDPAAKVSAGH